MRITGSGSSGRGASGLSVMTRLVGVSALSSLVPVFITVAIAVSVFSGQLEEEARIKARQAVAGIEGILDAERKETEALSRLIAEQVEIADEIRSGDTAALIRKIAPVWKESGLDFITVADARGALSRSDTVRPGNTGAAAWFSV